MTAATSCAPTPNTDLDAEEVALAYRNLIWIERHFRDLKTLLETRPIFHHLVKDNVKGHIFGCWLAFYRVVSLRKRIDSLNVKGVEWNDLVRAHPHREQRLRRGRREP